METKNPTIQSLDDFCALFDNPHRPPEITEHLGLPQDDSDPEPAMNKGLPSDLPSQNDMCMNVVNVRACGRGTIPKTSKPKACGR